jgi:surface antigen
MIPAFARRVALLLAVAALVALFPALAGAARADTTLCKSSDFSCLAGTGYTGQSVWGSWGPGHNCVSYAAYRLAQNGAAKPWGGRIGNGFEWDDFARAAGVRVDTTPAVGSIAQWDGRNHVAYVEAVTDSYIEISEDAYLTNTSGYSARRRLDRAGSAFGAAEFIHIKDIVSSGGTGGGSSDLYFIKTKSTGTGRVEVHVATAGSGYQASGGNWASWFSSAEQDNGWFQMADMDGDTKPDLVYIKTKYTGSGKVEVHVATASSGYQASGGNWASWFSSAEQDNGWFQIVGRDLYFIKTRNTGSGQAEVHVATVASGFQSSGGNWPSWFSSADRSNGWFQMVGRDLYFMKTRYTGTGRVEVHIATAGSGYQSSGGNWGSWFSTDEQSNGWFQAGNKS